MEANPGAALNKDGKLDHGVIDSVEPDRVDEALKTFFLIDDVLEAQER